MMILLTLCACGPGGDKDNKKNNSQGTIRISGAWALYPMMIRWADEYKKTHPACQIARGGPVTVTHPEVTRYFMTIPEAAQLVLQAGAMAKGGEIYLLDMGDPIKIMDLATDLISLSGLVLGEDIDIKFIGLRPGEKLHEELIAEKESLGNTPHSKISEVNSSPVKWSTLKVDIDNFFAKVDGKERQAIIKMLQKIVPDYHPDKKMMEQSDLYYR